MSDVDELIPQLQSKDAGNRCHAASALGYTDDKRATKPLIKVLSDTNEEVRAIAFFGLRNIGQPVVEDLIQTLKHPDDVIRKKASCLFQRMGDKLRNAGDLRAVEPLIEALEDPTAHVRCRAAKALGRLGDARAIGPLIERLKDDTNPDVYSNTCFALARMGQPTVDFLVPLLSDSQEHVRFYVALSLGKIGHANNGCAIDILTGALEDFSGFDWWRQRALLSSLARIGDARCIQPLIQLFNQQEGWVLRTIVYALGAIRDESATPFLIDLVKGRNKRIKVAAILALGQIGGDSAFRWLVKCLDTSHVGVRINVVVALGRFGIEAVPLLIDTLKDSDPRVRKQSVEMLGQIGGEMTAQPLVAMMADADKMVRRTVSRALRRIGTLALEPLIASLTQGDDRIRGKAVTALGRIGEERAIDTLTNALQDKSTSVRIKTVYALGKFGEMAEKGLKMALEDNTVSVRLSAILPQLNFFRLEVGKFSKTN